MAHLVQSAEQVKLKGPNVSAQLTLRDLPNELLTQILRCLDKTSLKKARLTCRRWGKAGAHSLFQRVYFAPRKDLMDIFSNITDNPAFAANITEMVYDARMYWSHMKEKSVYAMAFRRGFPEPYPENDISDDDVVEAQEAYENSHPSQSKPGNSVKLRRSRRRYASVLQEQISIIENELDGDTLCKGLARLPNLTRISVLDRFIDPLDYDDYLWKDFDWYHEWSAKRFEGINPPSRWSEADYNGDGANLYLHPWDFRGIGKLFEAAFFHAPRLRELFLGCRTSNLSTGIYGLTRVPQNILDLVSRLTALKVHCRVPYNYPEQPWIHHLQSILLEARNLERLYITLFNHNEAIEDWSTLFQKLKWPRLTVLDLCDGEMDFITLKAILQAHADVLRELRLQNVYLQGENTWEEVAIKLGKLTKLHFVSLSALSDKVTSRLYDDPYLPKTRRELTAIHFMSWTPAPERDLGIGSRCGASMVWHKQEFVRQSAFELIDGEDDSEDGGEEDEDSDTSPASSIL